MIKTISCVYKNSDVSHDFINQNELYEYPNLLVQVFCNPNQSESIKNIQQTLASALPLAIIMGCTTSGQILDGHTIDNETVLLFTTFEKTEMKSCLLHMEDYADGYDLGKSLISRLYSFDTKAVLLFSTNYSVDHELILNSLHEENSDIVIAGGVAGGSDLLHDGQVFDKGETTNQGIIAVALNSPYLKVDHYTNHRLQEIGKSFTVTKAKGTAIYSIERKKPIQILEKYLGRDFVDQIEQFKREFPFLIDSNERSSSIFINKLLPNGAIEVNRQVEDGDRLVFAYADLPSIIDDSLREMKKLSKKGVESIFIYNCLARKRLLTDFVEEEAKMLQSIAPVNGFFSNGEISYQRDGQAQMVGHSLTYLALTEDRVHSNQKKYPFSYELPEKLKTIVTLTHLMRASQEDIRVLNDNITISEQYYRSLFENNSDIVFSTDLHGNITSVNPAFEETLGYTKEELIGKSALKYVKTDDLPRVRMHFYRALKGREQYYNIELDSKTGEKNVIHMKNIPITVSGECVGIYGIGRNITEQKKIEDKMVQLAYYDQDTGLPNRLKFTEKLGELLRRAKKKKRMLAVLVIDMDRFKIINDSLGHDAGDDILKELSERIQEVLPSGAYLGRFSGDKFNLVLSKNVRIEEVLKVAKNILHHVSEPIVHSNQEFFVTASMGIAFYPNDGLDEITLIKNADIAMNRSKYPGGDRITLYANEMNEEALKRLELESYLRKALQKEEFFLCYQPLIDLESGQIYGSEALIRWNHPKLGLVSPGEFIPLAEETGLIEEIGSWVLRTACKQNKKWQLMGLKELTVSVNVSANQFQQKKFTRDVKRALNESGLEPKYLTLELTESTMLRDIDHSIEVMKSMQKIGVNVSIDDFGTGYSSLSYLKNLPINNLKIDRSFINNLRLDTSDIAIVKAIITMGHGLAVKVVAEGVETEEQIRLLKELKCHYAQGFYLHRPLKTDDFESALFQQNFA